MGRSSMLFSVSNSSLPGTATSVRPEMSPVSTSMVVMKVVSRSVALTVSLPSSRWKWKQLMMGTVLLLISTPLMDCSCLQNA